MTAKINSTNPSSGTSGLGSFRRKVLVLNSGEMIMENENVKIIPSWHTFYIIGHQKYKQIHKRKVKKFYQIIGLPIRRNDG